MSFHAADANAQIINGNKVYYDQARGYWTVLFVRDQIREQYNSEAEAKAAAAGGGGSEGDRNTAVVPKQAVQTAVASPTPAVKEFSDKSQAAVNQRISNEANVINVKVGNQEDGLLSLTATTTKGDANEGPAISVMTKNIRKGKETVVKTISAKSKLESVTGKTAKVEVVLNETIVQANPKGATQALRTVAKVSNKDLPECFNKLSPVPSLIKEAVDVEVNQGGIQNKVSQDMKTTSTKISISLKNPFGSNNKLGSVGSSFGNIFGQVVAIAQNVTETYQSPTKAVKAAVTETVINEKNQRVPTPNITNENGTTNTKDVVTKSTTEDINPDVESTLPPYEAGKGMQNYTILTKTELEGGTFRFPLIRHESHLTAELKSCEREITHLIIAFTKFKNKKQFVIEQLQKPIRNLRIKKFGQAAVNANPREYGFGAHFYVNLFGAIAISRDINLVSYKGGDLTQPRTGSIVVLVDAGEDDWPTAATPNQMHWLGFIIDEFIKVFPGAEILGYSDVEPDKVNNPPFDVREFVKSRNRKASTIKERVVEEVPPAADLADRQPANVPLPKKPSSTKIPNVAQVAREQNKKAAAVSSVNPQNYVKSQADALNLIKEKNDLIVGADKLFGTGQLGNLLGKVNGLDGFAKTVLDAAQDLKQGELKVGKVFDSIKGVFK